MRYAFFIKLNFGKLLGCLFVIQQKPEKNHLGNNMARRIMEIMKCISVRVYCNLMHSDQLKNNVSVNYNYFLSDHFTQLTRPLYIILFFLYFVR